MYSPDFSRMIGDDDDKIRFPKDLLEESVEETFYPVMDQFTAVIELKQDETLDAMWTGFRLAYARVFVFGAAGYA
jgi:hypothetical protein